jgi:hypothetical protein
VQRRFAREWRAAVLAGLRAKSALVLEIAVHHNLCSFLETGALFAKRDTRWDRALKVTGGGTGLVGHVGAVLLCKAADQARLTAVLSAVVRKAALSPSGPGDRAGRHEHERYRGAAAPGPGAGGRTERPDGAAGAQDLARPSAMLDRIARPRQSPRAGVDDVLPAPGGPVYLRLDDHRR